MNGAQALMKTLADAGVDVCFTNPGTSEMQSQFGKSNLQVYGFY